VDKKPGNFVPHKVTCNPPIPLLHPIYCLQAKNGEFSCSSVKWDWDQNPKSRQWKRRNNLACQRRALAPLGVLLRCPQMYQSWQFMRYIHPGRMRPNTHATPTRWHMFVWLKHCTCVCKTICLLFPSYRGEVTVRSRLKWKEDLVKKKEKEKITNCIIHSLQPHFSKHQPSLTTPQRSRGEYLVYEKWLGNQFPMETLHITSQWLIFLLIFGTVSVPSRKNVAQWHLPIRSWTSGGHSP